MDDKLNKKAKLKAYRKRYWLENKNEIMHKNTLWRLKHPNTSCYLCGKKIYRNPSRDTGHSVCSYACRNKYYSGGKSFAFKHGQNIGGKRFEIRDRLCDSARRERYKEMAVEFLGGKCRSCGYHKCIAALQFHHIDPKIKDRSIKDLICGSWKRIEKELKKCVLLCANCHFELHYKNRTYRREHEQKKYEVLIKKVQRII